MASADNDRLIGWKSIGAFVGRDARTVRRWEAERGLPVHRVPGGGSATVWADKAELTAWMAGATQLDSPESANEGSAVPDGADEQGAPQGAAPAPAARTRRPLVWGLAALVVLALGVIGFSYSPLLSAVSGQAARVADAKPYGANQAANAHYDAALYAMHRRSVAGLWEAERAFGQLSQVHPRNPAAFVGLAETNLLLREFNSLPEETAYRRAEIAAQQALALDPRSPGGLRALAFVRYWSDGKRAEGLRLFRQAIAARPADAQSLHWYGTALLGEGRFAESLDNLQQASALEPASSAIAADMGYVRYVAGDKAAGLDELRRVTRIDPQFAGAHAYLERLYLIEGADALYLAEALTTARLKQDEAKVALAQRAARAFANGGRAAMLTELITDAERRFEQHGETALDLARYHAAAGNRAAVLAWLNRAESLHQPDVRSLVAYPDFARYRGDPAFARFFSRR